MLLNISSAAEKVTEGHVAEAGEIASTALFLASEASSYITGQTIVTDGSHFASVKPLQSMMAQDTK